MTSRQSYGGIGRIMHGPHSVTFSSLQRSNPRIHHLNRREQPYRTHRGMAMQAVCRKSGMVVRHVPQIEQGVAGW
jgi:hypothetical protein